MRSFSKILMLFFIPISLLVNTSCGGETANLGDIKIIPSEPLVIHNDRNIPLAGTEGTIFRSLPAPNMQFRIEVDNKTGTSPITIIMGLLTVHGPKGTKNVVVDPSSMTQTQLQSGVLVQAVYPHGHIVEIQPGRKSTCMHKVDYLELSDTSSACPSDLDEGDDTFASDSFCCPRDGFTTANTWIYAGTLQDMTAEELADPNAVFVQYTFDLTLIGWVGSSQLPEANLRYRVNFQSSGL